MHSLGNVIGGRSLWRIACDTVLYSLALVDPNIVYVHFTWEHQVHPILMLEARRKPQIEDQVLERYN